MVLGLPPATIYLTLGALAAIENIFPPVPADTAVALGAFLAGTGRLTARSVFLVTWVANVTSAIAVYLLARRLGRPFFQSRIGQRLLHPHALQRIERMYRRFGPAGIFLSRFVPAVRAVVPPFAGVAGLGASRAVPPVVVASGIWYGVITYAAATLVRNAGEITAFVTRVHQVSLLVAGVVLVLGVILVWKVRRRRDHSA